MKKIIQILAATGLIIALPAFTFASNGHQEKENSRLGINTQSKVKSNRGLAFGKIHKEGNDDQDSDDSIIKQRDIIGQVTSASGTTFTLTSKDGLVYSVTTINAKIISAFDVALTIKDITVGSNVSVKGRLSGATITAQKIVVTPANTHPAQAFGKITAVNGNSFTLQTNNFGVISSVTINNASSTVISQSGTTTPPILTVGQKVQVKGLWDEVLNVLNAIKVKIF